MGFLVVQLNGQNARFNRCIQGYHRLGIAADISVCRETCG
jgi:hypothetical protein